MSKIVVTGDTKETPKLDVRNALRTLSKNDPILASLIKKIGPFPNEPSDLERPYDALARSIAYQQLTGKAAATIFGRVLALFGGGETLDPAKVVKTPDQKFRKAGLSGSKTAALKDLSKKFLEGVVPSAIEMHKMTNDEIIERLIQIRGIGQWTVEMLLIFHLKRMDVLPVTDYGVRKGVALVYKKRKLPTPKQLMEFGKIWAPYRSIAAWYMWRALELPKNVKGKPG